MSRPTPNTFSINGLKITIPPAKGQFHNLSIVMVLTGALVGATVLVGACPFSASWQERAWFLLLPYVLFGVAAVLGASFIQTRILFMALAVAWIVFWVDRYFFVMHDVGRGESMLAMGSVLVPCIAAVCYCLPERGMFSPYGAVRVAALLVLLGGMSIVSLTGVFSPGVDGTSSVYDGIWVRIPGGGLLALLASSPVLLYRKKGESPLLGAILLSSVLLIFLGFSFQSPLWAAGQPRTALILSALCGALILIGAALESSWWQMNRDELTELPNRRALKHRLCCLGGTYVIGVVEVDHFKSINDVHGHLVGDQVLRFLAAELSRNVFGKVYRYGGEEFVVIYERCAYEDALNNLDDAREAIRRKRFALRGADRPTRKPRKLVGTDRGQPSESLAITVSVGVAASGVGALPQEVLDMADKALYQAKERGRNQVCHVTR